MPRSKDGKKREPVDAESIKNALEAVLCTGEKKISIREACKVYNVKFTTLVRHLKNFKESGKETFNYEVKYDTNKVFTAAEEQSLVDYIQTVAKMNYGLTKKGVRNLAYTFAVANNKKHPQNWDEYDCAGEEWMRLFMKRHSQALSIRKPEKTSLSRATSFNRFNVSTFYDNLEDVHKRLGPFPAHCIWNQDETGLTTVQNPPKIVAPKGVRQIGGVTSGERGHLVTMSCCVSATGNQIPPMLIFPRVNFRDFMLKGAPPGTIGGANPSGWSNDALYLQFIDHFISHVKPTKENKVLLIIDNHETHLSYEAVVKASDAGIVILTFPPHTSHKLQPLDVSVNSSLKSNYNQAVDAWLMNNPGKTFDIYCIAEMVGQIYSKVFCPRNIVSGFEKTGIFPFNRDVFTDEDFLGSFVSDRPNPIDNPTEECQHRSDKVDTTEANQVTSLEDHNYYQPSTSKEIQGVASLVDQMVSPEQIQPYPKALQRKTARRGRKPGRSKIATDTPEKEEIKREKIKNKVKNSQTDMNKSTTHPKKKQNVSRKIEWDSESDIDDLVPYEEEDHGNDLSALQQIVDEELAEAQEELALERPTFCNGDYILVGFDKKRGLKEYYVGQIVSQDMCGFEFKVQFFQRIGLSSKFMMKSTEEFDVNEEDILIKLPKPTICSGSQRTMGQIWFKVDFSTYNVK